MIMRRVDMDCQNNKFNFLRQYILQINLDMIFVVESRGKASSSTPPRATSTSPSPSPSTSRRSIQSAATSRAFRTTPGASDCRATDHNTHTALSLSVPETLSTYLAIAAEWPTSSTRPDPLTCTPGPSPPTPARKSDYPAPPACTNSTGAPTVPVLAAFTLLRPLRHAATNTCNASFV